MFLCSPQSWGLTGLETAESDSNEVFPAVVGINRNTASKRQCLYGVPRSRGD